MKSNMIASGMDSIIHCKYGLSMVLSKNVVIPKK